MAPTAPYSYFIHLLPFVNGYKCIDLGKHIAMQPTRTCAYCDKPIAGRSDKKFCDDQCRVAYNNRQNSDATNYMRNVNNILRKNRRILEELNTEKGGVTTVPKSRLTARGFMFDYFTNVLQTKAGKVYYFCYEYGYLLLEGDKLMLVKRNEDKRKEEG